MHSELQDWVTATRQAPWVALLPPLAASASVLTSHFLQCCNHELLLATGIIGTSPAISELRQKGPFACVEPNLSTTASMASNARQSAIYENGFRRRLNGH